MGRVYWPGCILTAVVLFAGCREDARSIAPTTTQAPADDPHLKSMGSIEVTAKLVEIPDGAIFKRELYDFATVLKYEVLQTHRGKTHAGTIYVAHYNPFKPRSEAADRRVKEVGGNVSSFAAGQVHHMALESPVEDHFMGGLVNKYFGTETGPIYWALWTDSASR